MSFCDNQTPTCDTCNSITLTCDNMKFDVGLSDGTYYFTIIDKFGKGWTNQYTVSSSSITLDLNNYPDGFISELSGKLELFAHTLENDFTRLDMDIEGTIYKCILITVDGVCCQ